MATGNAVRCLEEPVWSKNSRRVLLEVQFRTASVLWSTEPVSGQWAMLCVVGRSHLGEGLPGGFFWVCRLGPLSCIGCRLGKLGPEGFFTLCKAGRLVVLLAAELPKAILP